MSNLTSVTITAGVPTTGTGTVSTLDAVMADGGISTLGTKTDNKSTATDTTATSLVSISKQVSASVQSIDSKSVAVGQTVMASSVPVTLASNQSAVPASQSGTWTVQPGNTANTTAWKVDGSAVTQPVSNTYLTQFGTGYYVTVAASQTATVLQSTTGATGDYISGVLVIPATTSPGNVLLLDNSTSITIFTGGATSVSNLVPFFIPINSVSRSGAWKLTTGANVSCIAVGKFS